MTYDALVTAVRMRAAQLKLPFTCSQVVADYDGDGACTTHFSAKIGADFGPKSYQAMGESCAAILAELISQLPQTQPTGDMS